MVMHDAVQEDRLAGANATRSEEDGVTDPE